MLKTAQFMLFLTFWSQKGGYLGCSEQASKTLVKKKNFFFFFEIFEKSADFATKFGWGISATKGPLEKKRNRPKKVP